MQNLIQSLFANKELLYGILISAFVVLLTLVPLSDNLKIRKYKFGERKTFSDKTKLFFRKTFVKTILILVLSAAIFVITREKEQFLANKAEKELFSRDSIRELADNIRTLNIVKELGKSGFEIDSLTNEIIKLKGEIKKPGPQPNPTLSFSLIFQSMSNDSLTYELNILSNEARSRIFLNYDVGYRVNSKWYLLNKNQTLGKGILIEKGKNRGIDLYFYQKPFVADCIVVCIRGYYLSDTNKKKTIDEYVMYDIKSRQSGTPIQSLNPELDLIFRR